MSTKNQNLSAYDASTVPNADGFKVGIIVSEWNYSITGSLLDGAKKTLIKHGIKESDITIEHVPGTFELTYGAKKLAQTTNFDSIITIGCVIQGETPHFTFVCEGVTQGITTLNLEYNTPVIFGVLTTDTMEQAQDRSGGKYGNKGDEAAITALKMIALNKKYK